METINDRLQWIVNEKFDGNKAALQKPLESCQQVYLII